MSTARFSTAAAVVLPVLALAGAAGLIPAASAAAARVSQAASGYDDLVVLFESFRELREPTVNDGVPDYTAAAMDRQYRG